MPTICLAMIVRNEAEIIRRALLSALPFIDSYFIIDTGSTDGTQDIIRETLKDIPGEIQDQPWVDFGFNRTQLVELAREKADYLLLLDADYVLGVYSPFREDLWEPKEMAVQFKAWFQKLLKGDSYELRFQGGLDYTKVTFISTKLDWKYVGVTHEYIEAEGAGLPEALPVAVLIDYNDGTNRADKFRRDADLLDAALKVEPDNTRYQFYLAQSLRDQGDFVGALHWYGVRAAGAGFDEEKWYAMFQAARMVLKSGGEWTKALALFVKAYAYRPHRFEPLYEIAKYYLENDNPGLAFTFIGFVGFGFAYPNADRLFIDREVYHVGLPYAFFLAARATGRKEAAEFARQTLLKVHDLPDSVKQVLDEASPEAQAAAAAPAAGPQRVPANA